jgi:hypothetical protein
MRLCLLPLFGPVPRGTVKILQLVDLYVFSVQAFHVCTRPSAWLSLPRSLEWVSGTHKYRRQGLGGSCPAGWRHV